MKKRIYKVFVVITTVISLALSLSVFAHAANVNFDVVNERIVEEYQNILKDEGEKIVFVRHTTSDGYEVREINYVETEEIEEETATAEPTEIETVGTEPTIVETEPEETEAIIEETVDPDADPLKIVETNVLENGTRILRFKKGDYTVPNKLVYEEPHVTKSGYVEKIYNVPHYLQQSYQDTKYGNYGTVSSHGCGITCCAMAYSYLLDREIFPDELATEYGRFNTSSGSTWALFETTAKEFGLEIKQTTNWSEVVEALENGCIVIANVRSQTIFTSGGHYILYYGITEEGKVLVKDPNIYNYGQWSGKILTEGFANGFEQKYVRTGSCYWIYAPKDLEAIAAKSEAESVAEVELFAIKNSEA